MPIESGTVPIQPAPLPMTLREDDFNATLVRQPPTHPNPALSGLYDSASRAVCWPGDGGRVTRLLTSPWNGASALYFDFYLNEDLRVHLDPDGELLLTFFLAGHVTGQVGDERGPVLDFRVNRMLLRTPNRAGGYLIHIPGACRNHFVQFRLRRALLPHWLQALGVRLPARRMDELVERDDGRVLCNAALTPRVRACLARIRAERADQPAFVPLFHAHATELLTCVLLELEALLQPARSGIAQGGGDTAERTLERMRALVAESPARDWTVHVLAQHLGCSSARLQRQVREASGRSVYQLLLDERQALAARLLRETRLSVQAIAAETGWYCHSRFSATFRKYHGLAPREYRLQHAVRACVG
ncbi:helix-turn-helix transcriptional regulator [Micropruina sp.]|uniref:helix-turn-helix transcriptional regulator n=1 Tax=Micropruina sp. TaxID=2737536 RepID=UPI0039E36EEF